MRYCGFNKKQLSTQEIHVISRECVIQRPILFWNWYDRMGLVLLLGDSRLSREQFEVINKWVVLLERIGLVSAAALILSRACIGCAMAVLDR